MFAIFAAILIALEVASAQNNTCGQNEVLLDSGNECTCDNHCYSRNSTSCFCQTGFSRDSNGDCINNASCPAPLQCAENQVAVSCLSPCPPTCENPNPLICPTALCTKGCACKEGFILRGNGADHVCIPSDQCSAPADTTPGAETTTAEPNCPVNQEFRQTGTECICNEHCYQKSSPSCMCKEGYVKNQGVCISNAECLGNRNQTCSENQELVPCVNPCAPTCDDLDKEPCPSFSCLPGCACKAGFVQKPNGNDFDCVPTSQCLGKSPDQCQFPCRDYEVFGQTGYECYCSDHCFDRKSPSCFCKDGLYRSEDGQCITKEQCGEENHDDHHHHDDEHWHGSHARAHGSSRHHGHNRHHANKRHHTNKRHHGSKRQHEHGHSRHLE